MVLRREFVIDRDDSVTFGSYDRRPRLDAGFIAAYESSAVCPKDGRKRASGIFRTEDIEPIVSKLGRVLDVLLGANSARSRSLA